MSSCARSPVQGFKQFLVIPFIVSSPCVFSVPSCSGRANGASLGNHYKRSGPAGLQFTEVNDKAGKRQTGSGKPHSIRTQIRMIFIAPLCRPWPSRTGLAFVGHRFRHARPLRAFPPTIGACPSR